MARGGAVLAPEQVDTRIVVGMEAGGFGNVSTALWQRSTVLWLRFPHVAKWRRIAGFLWQNGNGSPDSRNAAAIHMSGPDSRTAAGPVRYPDRPSAGSRTGPGTGPRSQRPASPAWGKATRAKSKGMRLGKSTSTGGVLFPPGIPPTKIQRNN